MKLHQNRLDRFSVIAKQLVDNHATEFHNDLKKATQEEAFNNHLQTLGKQLEEYAGEFLNNCKVQNEQFRKEVWGTCNRYIDLFTRIHQPTQLTG